MLTFRHILNLVLLVFCAFFLSNCKKDKQSDIVVEYPLFFPENMEMDTLNVNTWVVRESNEFPTTLDEFLKDKNTNKSKIKSAKLTSMRIQILDFALADSINWCNIQDISDMEVDIKSSTVGQRTVAFKQIPDVRVPGVNLDMTGAELKDFLQEDKFSMVFKYLKRRAMEDQMPFVITLRFLITAEAL